MRSVLQDKILNYEVSPPAGAWEKIAAALDESELAQEFPSRLYGAEVIPPVSAWNKIAASLDEAHEKTIPEKRKISPLVRYAAAAVVIGLLGWGGLQLMNNKPGNKDMARQQPAQTEKGTHSPLINPDSITQGQLSGTTENDMLSEDDRNDAALEASKKTFAKLDLPAKSRIKEIAAGYYFPSSTEPENIPGVMQQNEMNSVDLASRYITLITPEGNIIRMSKKLTGMVCCVSGEDENMECRDQIKKWREKIICSPTCSSAGTFMDMLDLVEALQEN